MGSSTLIRSLFFLQIIPLILYPPSTLAGGLAIFAVAAVAVAALGFMAIRGRPWALTMSIFIQGFNAIVRIMMFFSHAMSVTTGTPTTDWPYIIFSLTSIALSIWFLYRLDRADVRLLVGA